MEGCFALYLGDCDINTVVRSSKSRQKDSKDSKISCSIHVFLGQQPPLLKKHSRDLWLQQFAVGPWCFTNSLATSGFAMWRIASILCLTALAEEYSTQELDQRSSSIKSVADTTQAKVRCFFATLQKHAVLVVKVSF